LKDKIIVFVIITRLYMTLYDLLSQIDEFAGILRATIIVTEKLWFH